MCGVCVEGRYKIGKYSLVDKWADIYLMVLKTHALNPSAHGQSFAILQFHGQTE